MTTAAVSAAYAPATVNTDGWKATQAAWRTLFPTVVVILCFLHGFLKIRDRCRKAFGPHTNGGCVLVQHSQHGDLAQRDSGLEVEEERALERGKA